MKDIYKDLMLLEDEQEEQEKDIIFDELHSLTHLYKDDEDEGIVEVPWYCFLESVASDFGYDYQEMINLIKDSPDYIVFKIHPVGSFNGAICIGAKDVNLDAVKEDIKKMCEDDFGDEDVEVKISLKESKLDDLKVSSYKYLLDVYDRDDNFIERKFFRSRPEADKFVDAMEDLFDIKIFNNEVVEIKNGKDFFGTYWKVIRDLKKDESFVNHKKEIEKILEHLGFEIKLDESINNTIKAITKEANQTSDSFNDYIEKLEEAFNDTCAFNLGLQNDGHVVCNVEIKEAREEKFTKMSQEQVDRLQELLDKWFSDDEYNYDIVDAYINDRNNHIKVNALDYSMDTCGDDVSHDYYRADFGSDEWEYIFKGNLEEAVNYNTHYYRGYKIHEEPHQGRCYYSIWKVAKRGKDGYDVRVDNNNTNALTHETINSLQSAKRYIDSLIDRNYKGHQIEKRSVFGINDTYYVDDKSFSSVEDAKTYIDSLSLEEDIEKPNTLKITNVNVYPKSIYDTSKNPILVSATINGTDMVFVFRAFFGEYVKNGVDCNEANLTTMDKYGHYDWQSSGVKISDGGGYRTYALSIPRDIIQAEPKSNQKDFRFTGQYYFTKPIKDYFKKELQELYAKGNLTTQFLNAINVTTQTEENIDEDIEKHDTLNQKLFDGEELKPEVVEAIKNIANEFVKELGEDGISFTLKDIILLGSNMSYNYTKDSDLDIHLIADSNALECPKELQDKLYGAYRTIFNKNYDITLKGIPAEVYVELDEPRAKSNGIYSLNNGWVKKPEQQAIPELDKEAFDEFFKFWEDRYNELVDNKEATSEDVEEYINDIYDERKDGIANDGEYSLGNLLFKEVRNKGYLDNLKELRKELKGKELSLEHLEEDAEVGEEVTLENVRKWLKTGGATIQNKTGKSVVYKDGFEISFNEPEVKFKVDLDNDKDIQKVVRVLKKRIKENKHPYTGIWYEDDSVVMDYSKHFKGSKEDAIKDALKNNQRMIFNWGYTNEDDKYISTVDNK